MPNLDIGELVVDPDFTQIVTVKRSTITWVGGRVTTTETEFQAEGIVDPGQPTKTDHLQVDYVDGRGYIFFYSMVKLFDTVKDATGSYISDIITWNGNHYKVKQLKEYNQYGYYDYRCDRMEG